MLLDVVAADRPGDGLADRPAAHALAVEAELRAEPVEAVEDDVEGARSVGIRAILIDRLGRYPEFVPRLDDLYGLPAALGLPRP